MSLLALVTGGGGFLGRRIVEMLVARGDGVRTIARGHYPDLARLGVETVRADIADSRAVDAACRGVDVVFHTAAVAGIWGPWQRYYQTNVVGTRNVVQGCRRNGVPKLVFTSSPSVTFDGGHQRAVDERAPCPRRWLSHYPHTKALSEADALAANGQDGLATCALRPHLIWGPGDRHLVPRLLDRARRGRLRRVGDGQNRIDMIYVDNAAAAHLLAADALTAGSAVAGKTYFVSQGEPVGCWQWIDEILALAGLPPVVRSVSLPAAYAIGAACEAAWTLLRRQDEPPMTRFLALQLGRDHYFDIGAARRDFGYAPAISTAEGMSRLGAELQARHA